MNNTGIIEWYLGCTFLYVNEFLFIFYNVLFSNCV